MPYQTIYFCYYRETGEFAGNGTPYFDTDEIACNEIETPDYNPITESVRWTGTEWVVISPYENE